MSSGFDELVAQWEGTRFAELILHHYKKQKPNQISAAVQGLIEQNGERLKEPTSDIIDILNSNPNLHEFFKDDLSAKFLWLSNVTKGLLDKKYGISISEEEYFNIFNIVVLNWAAACHQSPQTKAAMQKAAGVGLIGRLFG